MASRRQPNARIPFPDDVERDVLHDISVVVADASGPISNGKTKQNFTRQLALARQAFVAPLVPGVIIMMYPPFLRVDRSAKSWAIHPQDGDAEYPRRRIYDWSSVRSRSGLNAVSFAKTSRSVIGGLRSPIYFCTHIGSRTDRTRRWIGLPSVAGSRPWRSDAPQTPAACG
jgi:hypothetical protein